MVTKTLLVFLGLGVLAAIIGMVLGAIDAADDDHWFKDGD